MSAPREIWADQMSSRWMEAGTRPVKADCQHVYHHDDVVRELVEALEEIAGSADDSDGWTSDGHERCTEAAAAALAKIAQEG